MHGYLPLLIETEIAQTAEKSVLVGGWWFHHDQPFHANLDLQNPPENNKISLQNHETHALVKWEAYRKVPITEKVNEDIS